MKGLDLGEFSIEPYGNDYTLVCTFRNGTKTLFHVGSKNECQDMMKTIQHDLGIH